jgi:hypothetical protein
VHGIGSELFFAPPTHGVSKNGECLASNGAEMGKGLPSAGNWGSVAFGLRARGAAAALGSNRKSAGRALAAGPQSDRETREA